MSGRPSAATEKALLLIGKPKKDGSKYTPYAAAKECGIALSTIYRAMARAGAPLGTVMRGYARDIKRQQRTKK